ncbi:unnamed protein product, partial [Brassica rapa]
EDSAETFRPNSTYDSNRLLILSSLASKRNGWRCLFLQLFYWTGTKPSLRNGLMHPRIRNKGLLRLYNRRSYRANTELSPRLPTKLRLIHGQTPTHSAWFITQTVLWRTMQRV